MRLQVFILSNQTLYADALKSLLKEESQYTDVHIFAIKNPKVNALINVQKPDIILLDINNVSKSIWEFMNGISNQSSNSRIIMLADFNEVMYREYAIRYGAKGYILKSSPKELLAAAIKIVVKGGYFFDPGNQDINTQTRHSELKGKYKLTSREMEIIQLIKDGFSSKDVASHLNVSFHTVESHRKNIYNKLNIRKVADLLKVYRSFES